jgi:hypothetical protein
MNFTDVNQSKELFKLGFPQDKAEYAWFEGALVPTINVRDNNVDRYGYNEDMERFIAACPTIGELISFVGARFGHLSFCSNGWEASAQGHVGLGLTPIDAVYELVRSVLSKDI